MKAAEITIELKQNVFPEDVEALSNVSGSFYNDRVRLSLGPDFFLIDSLPDEERRYIKAWIKSPSRTYTVLFEVVNYQLVFVKIIDAPPCFYTLQDLIDHFSLVEETNSRLVYKLTEMEIRLKSIETNLL